MIDLSRFDSGQGRLLRGSIHRRARTLGARLVNRLDDWRQQLLSADAGPARRLTAKLLNVMRDGLLLLRSFPPDRALRTSDLSAPALLMPQDFVKGRVLMINSSLTWGGAERQLVNTMVGLSRRGFDVRLAGEYFGRVAGSTFFAPELERHGLPFDDLRKLGAGVDQRLPQDLAATLERRIEGLPQPYRGAVLPYVAAILALRPEIVHCWQDQTNALAGVAASIVGVPCIVLATRNMAPIHFIYHQPHLRAAYQVLAANKAVRLLNNSHAGAADYANWLNMSASCFRIVHNGFDFDSATADAEAPESIINMIPTDVPVIGGIFRFHPEKDPLLWIRMATLIAWARPDIHFLLLGAGPLEADIRAEATKGGLGTRLHLPGTHANTTAILKRLSVFALTSRFEGLPNVLIEAQAQGVPVVSTRAGGAGETFIQGETGFLVNERDPKILARHVLDILDDPAFRAHCGNEAPRLVRARFGLARMVDETVALYRDAAPSIEEAG